ncbi:hypothetical protein MKX08_002319 [Trichoderma sp. CBMAI-0020]|nr:hypothetical protein MKX08_002319 [Trichoderma sp. CBMAI-0020]
MSKKVSWHSQIPPPLNHSNSEIRVFQIKPGSPDSPIRCTFHVTSLDNLDISYEALSYAWGTDNQNTTHEDIYFGDDDDDTNKVGVTPPLANALRRLRLLNEPRQVWADALCINQTDNHEKSLQVSIMGRIYSTCAQGAIWLGPLGDMPEEDAQAALDTISWIAGEQEAHSWMEVSDSEEDGDEDEDEDEDEDANNSNENPPPPPSKPSSTSPGGPASGPSKKPSSPCQIPWATLDRAADSFFDDSAPNVPNDADRGMHDVSEGLRVEGDGDVLLVSGLCVSKIDMVEDNVPEEIEVPEEVSVAALYRLYGDRWGELMTQYHRQFSDKLFGGGMVAFLSLITGNLVSDGSEDNNEIAEWMQKMLRTHIFFITDDGRLGLGPRNVRRGCRR